MRLTLVGLIVGLIVGLPSPAVPETARHNFNPRATLDASQVIRDSDTGSTGRHPRYLP